MVGPRGRNLTRGRSSLVAVANQKLPFIRRILELIEIEGDKVVEKVTFNLTPKHVKLGTKNINGVAITSCWTRVGGNCPRPLSGR
jgi:hypothetical protein